MRQLTVLADGIPFAAGCRFHLTGKTNIGLYPSLFLLECWNLREQDYLLLSNTRELAVYREDSCLAFGTVSDVFRRNRRRPHCIFRKRTRRTRIR